VRAWAGLKSSWGMGRAMWPRIPTTCVSARSLVHDGREEVKLTGKAHDAERERKGAPGATAWCLAERAHETEKEEGHAAKQLAPTSRPHWAASEREGRERGTDCH
jgi:hypothetical protein